VDDAPCTREQRLLIEEFGLVFEEIGGTRMAGRIAGFLLLCDPPVQSLTQIADALGVSKGAVSSSMRFLTQRAIVERVCEPGRRGDWYRSRPGPMDAQLRSESFHRVKELLGRALATVADKDPSHSNYALLLDLYDFHTFLEREMPTLVERWERGRTALPDNVRSTGPSTPANHLEDS
jgi:hypothetical protein